MKSSTRLLKWYANHGRKLPWRNTMHPYRILVSEIMLQQTQVHRVIDFYKRWLKQFPTWKALAEAKTADVIRAWSGLGYNRRALQLRDIARSVVKNGVPQTEEEWRSLKGIGPYTAAALTIFSLGKRATPVDTNIRRVIGRIDHGILFPTMDDDSKISMSLEKNWMSNKKFVHVPQALFDLATMHCTKSPQCATCPMASVCASAETFLSGSATIPARTIKTTRERHHRNKPFPDRIYRGRILKLVQTQPRILKNAIGPLVDDDFVRQKDTVWLHGMIKRLVRDGLIQDMGGRLTLPNE